MAGRWPAVLVAGCLLCGCQSPDRADLSSRTTLALGTVITVEIHGMEESGAERALDAVENYFQSVQRDWYAFGNGELGHVNEALSHAKSVEMSADLASLTRRSLELRDLSDGLFDPTIGMLVELWGFGDAENMPATPPDERAIQRWKNGNNADSGLRLSGRTISTDRPVKLAFGGIAKGTALNGAAALLRDMGVINAIIAAGGDLKVLGQRGDRRWRVGIRDPHSIGVLGIINLAPGEAIVTSGNYERYFKHEARRYHHLLDPFSGLPVTHTAGVTVIHIDAELADAAATALMIAGPPRFDEIAKHMGIDTALLVTTGGVIIMTPAMAGRIREPVQSGHPEPSIM